ncbi:MAG: adenosylmethionine--8-amino-7-oxononanoate transaminase [Planctomycetes bacterium]|nr:adenosylmethionine--8-amino-7-oxononanoate transaminase [Planctomycetota bacterium]
MNERTKKVIEADKKCVWHPFTQMSGWVAGDPVVIESGDGFYLIDTEGRRYIDGVSSLWCNVHGHRVKRIDDAIKAQVDKISHSTLLGLGQSRSIELAEKLVGITPAGLEKVFYSDNGSTSVEIALKMVYQYYRNKGVNGREKFIAIKNSYHGDTIGSVSVGGMELFHGIFGALLFETYFVPCPHPYRYDGSSEECKAHSLEAVEALLKEKGSEIAGVIVEPLVQGAGGILVHPAGFLKGVSELARKYDVKLIVDEVATGFGRTGKMFACEHEGVRPDVMCLAKGITGGYLPLAATVTTNDIYDAFLGEASECKTFYHGHTYTGNALGCAAAIASLELFEDNDIIASLGEKVELISERLGEIKGLPYVGDVRQCGMMAGIEIVKDKASGESFEYEKLIGAKVCRAMREKGAMMRPLGDVIVLMPPVGVDVQLLGDLLDIIKEAIEYELPKVVK